MNRGLIGGFARRRAAAGLVLVVTFVLCFWIAQYKQLAFTQAQGHAIRLAFPSTPDWAIPTAIAVGLGGAVLAFLISRSHQRRR